MFSCPASGQDGSLAAKCQTCRDKKNFTKNRVFSILFPCPLPAGLILKTNKKYSQTVQKAFHLSQAALDLSKSNGGDVQVMLTSEENTYLLCTLGKDRPQVALDLNFEEGDQISLATKGDGMVHLTGYLVPSEEDMFGGLGDEEEDEEEDAELEEEVAAPAKNGKAAKQVGRRGMISRAGSCHIVANVLSWIKACGKHEVTSEELELSAYLDLAGIVYKHCEFI